MAGPLDHQHNKSTHNQPFQQNGQSIRYFSRHVQKYDPGDGVDDPEDGGQCAGLFRVGDSRLEGVCRDPASVSDFLRDVEEEEQADAYLCDLWQLQLLHLVLLPLLAVVQLRRVQEREGNQRHEGQDPQRTHRMFLVVDDNSRANEPADAEEEVEQLDPEVLPHADEQLKHAEVAEDVHHAASGPSDQHGHCQVDEPEAKRANYQRTPAYHDKKGEEAVIGEVLGQEGD